MCSRAFAAVLIQSATVAVTPRLGDKRHECDTQYIYMYLSVGIHSRSTKPQLSDKG
jgi:hypothetical protein